MTSDVSDQATELEEAMRQQGLARLQAASTLRRLHGAPASSKCAECGEPIPPARRAAIPDCTRCVPCERSIQARKRLKR